MEMEFADNDAKYAKITVRTTDGSNLTGNVYLGDQDRVSDLFVFRFCLFHSTEWFVFRHGPEKCCGP